MVASNRKSGSTQINSSREMKPPSTVSSKSDGQEARRLLSTPWGKEGKLEGRAYNPRAWQSNDSESRAAAVVHKTNAAVEESSILKVSFYKFIIDCFNNIAEWSRFPNLQWGSFDITIIIATTIYWHHVSHTELFQMYLSYLISWKIH